MKGICWRLADYSSTSELKRTLRINFRPFAPMEFPEGSGLIRGRGFDFWINTPWVSVAVYWNSEQPTHEFLRDGIVVSWGRNKGWSSRKTDRDFYRHTSTRFSRLKVNPIFGNPEGENLHQINLDLCR